jgi:hypothetical protein
MAKASIDIIIPPKLGQIIKGEGGRFAGMMRGLKGAPDYYLIVPPEEYYGKALEYGGYGEDEPNAVCEYDGAANTIALLNSKIEHPAAHYASSIIVEGRDDYYLPARRELRAIGACVPELLPEDWIWSSTACDRRDAIVQVMDGDQSWRSKKDRCAVLPVRRLACIVL